MKIIQAVAVLAMVVMVGLCGCAPNGSMNISQLPVGDEVITALSGDIRDASTQKEAIYFHAVETRDMAQRKMHEKSGTKIKFAMKEVSPGVHVQVMESIETREMPKFAQALPDGPSEHPVWKTVNKVLDKGMDTFLWWTGIRELASFGKQATANREATVVRPEVIKVEPFVVEPFVVE